MNDFDINESDGFFQYIAKQPVASSSNIQSKTSDTERKSLISVIDLDGIEDYPNLTSVIKKEEVDTTEKKHREMPIISPAFAQTNLNSASSSKSSSNLLISVQNKYNKENDVVINSIKTNNNKNNINNGNGSDNNAEEDIFDMCENGNNQPATSSSSSNNPRRSTDTSEVSSPAISFNDKYPFRNYNNNNSNNNSDMDDINDENHPNHQQPAKTDFVYQTFRTSDEELDRIGAQFQNDIDNSIIDMSKIESIGRRQQELSAQEYEQHDYGDVYRKFDATCGGAGKFAYGNFIEALTNKFLTRPFKPGLRTNQITLARAHTLNIETPPTMVLPNIIVSHFDVNQKYLREAVPYKIANEQYKDRFPELKEITVNPVPCVNGNRCVGKTYFYSEGLNRLPVTDEKGNVVTPARPFTGGILMAYGPPEINLEIDHEQCRGNMCLMCLSRAVTDLVLISQNQGAHIMANVQKPIINIGMQVGTQQYLPAAVIQADFSENGLLAPFLNFAFCTQKCFWRKDEKGFILDHGFLQQPMTSPPIALVTRDYVYSGYSGILK